MEYSLPQQNDDYILDIEDKVRSLKARIREMKLILNGERHDGKIEPSLFKEDNRLTQSKSNNVQSDQKFEYGRTDLNRDQRAFSARKEFLDSQYANVSDSLKEKLLKLKMG